MIKQDYLLRMIQEIITLLINALLNRQKIRKESWVDMSADEIIDRYQDDPNQMGKTELAAVTMLKISDEMGDEQLVLKSKLKQDGLALLEYVQTKGDTFSIQRVALMAMLKG